MELKLVILDEPTAALGVAQTEQVLELVRRLAEQGLAVVLISHNLHDIFEMATRITVLRLGRNVGVYERAKTTQQEVVHAITAGIPTKVAGHRRVDAGGRGMSTDADVVAPGIGLPGGRRRGAPGLWQRALGNVKSGNLGVLPVVIGEVLIVAYFSFTATNFFTASNFVNVILQMAGVTMIAFGVVFVLLIAEIDLSIGFLSGIAALTAAELQLPDGRNYPGWLCILIALGVVAIIGAAQGTFVAKVGVPSFVVTLAGLLIWQGVILKVLQVRGVIIIEEDWINKTATYYFSASVSWIIAAVVTGRYALVVLGGSSPSGEPASSSAAADDREGRGSRDRGLRRRRDLHARDEGRRPCPEGTPLTWTARSPSGCRSRRSSCSSSSSG